MPKEDVIELNGKRYNSRSGKMLATESGSRAHKQQPIKYTGVSLDGVAKRSPSTPRPKTPAHTVHSKTEKSRTLMRTVVKKPEPKKSDNAAPHIKKHPTRQYNPNPRLVSKAGSVKKSSLISRFGAPAGSLPPKPISAPLNVRPEPPAPPVFDHHQLSSVEKKSHSIHMQRAMESSNSHNQPRAEKATRRHKIAQKLRVSPRALNIGATSLAVLLLAGFITYQNIPNLSMRLASARAGVSGRVPAYKPSGFGMSGPIQYKQGQVVVNYRSRTDDRAFSVSQKSTQWNSETLLENYIVAEGKSYQTYEDSGKTIYIYDENSATWVDGGVWYQIESKAALNSDQLLRLAASM